MARYPKLSEKIHSERNYLRCKEDWVAHAVELEQAVERLTAEVSRLRDAGSILRCVAEGGAIRKDIVDRAIVAVPVYDPCAKSD